MNINGKHTIEELNGIRCSVVEKDISAERAEFLKKVLEYNKFEVQIQKILPPPPKPAKPTDPPTDIVTPSAEPDTFKVGVTDVTFVISTALYSRKIKTLTGKIISQNYWTQNSPEFGEWYWTFKKK